MIGLSEYLPYNIWKFFINEKGYKIKDNIIYQENQIAIRMERNGRCYYTGNSRHIGIR